MPTGTRALVICAFKVFRSFVSVRRHSVAENEGRLQELVDAALSQWRDAKAFCDANGDPDLVEYAAYDVKAKERRYVYLFECAKVADKNRMKVT